MLHANWFKTSKQGHVKCRMSLKKLVGYASTKEVNLYTPASSINSPTFLAQNWQNDCHISYPLHLNSFKIHREISHFRVSFATQTCSWKKKLLTRHKCAHVKDNNIISEMSKFGVLWKTFKTIRLIILDFYLSLTLEHFLTTNGSIE